MKFVPVKAIVTTLPTWVAAGFRLVRVGPKLVTVKVCGGEVPPPGAGLVTVTGKAPAVATSAAANGIEIEVALLTVQAWAVPP